MSAKDDISTKCTAEQIAAADIPAIRDVVNAGRTRVDSVSRNVFAIWCGKTGLRAVIEDIAATVGHPLRSIALTCKDMLTGGPDALDLSNSDNQLMLGAWVMAGALTQDQADELIGLATFSNPYTEAEVAEALEQLRAE